jgi:DNA-binding response OmpR family regulator
MQHSVDYAPYCLEESNLVDVHMGKLRRKVDGPNGAPMICSVRVAGWRLMVGG